MTPDARFQRCVGIIFHDEAGFVDDPEDPGGATNRGITIGTLSHWRGHQVSVDDVRNLTLEEAQAIYRASYWNAVAGDQLPGGVELIAFDCAVNQGPGTAVKLLQQAAGVDPDGHIGPLTLSALRTKEALLVIDAIHDERMVRYRTSSGWARFGRGWTNRLNDIADQAHQWAQHEGPLP